MKIILSQSGKKEYIRNETDNMWTVNPGILESDDVAKSCPISYRTINQYGGITCRPSFSRVNPETIGCMWTGEFHPTYGRRFFESSKKKLRIQKLFEHIGTWFKLSQG